MGRYMLNVDVQHCTDGQGSNFEHTHKKGKYEKDDRGTRLIVARFCTRLRYVYARW